MSACAHTPPPSTASEPSAADTTAGGPRLALGGGQSCVLSGEGELTCWGRTSGDAPDGRFASVALGHANACAARIEGGVECWGQDSDTLSMAPDARLSALAVGDAFGCGLVQDGTLACWGDNSTHQAEPPLGRYVDVRAGRAHACALGQDGVISCWGDNRHGQGVPASGRFVALSTGPHHNCGVGEDGGLHCWGKGGKGSKPAAPSGHFVDVATGTMHGCALSDDGTLRCWGDNGDGQASAPKGRFFTLASGDVHTCGVRYPTGKLVCWGNDYNGESSPPSRSAKLELPTGLRYRAAARQPSEHEDDGAPGVSFGKVIVLGLHSMDGDDEDARALSFGLRDASTRVAGYAVGDETMSSNQLDLALGCDGMDAKCVKKIATSLDAAAVVYGTMRRDKASPRTRRVVDLHIYEALSGKISGSTKQVMNLSQLKRPELLQRSEQILRALHEASR